jgi:hypothetical protein
LADHAIPKTTSTTFHQNTSLAKKPTYSTGPTHLREAAIAEWACVTSRRFVTGSDDGTARLWDAQTATPLLSATAHRDRWRAENTVSVTGKGPDRRWRED